MAFDNTSHTEIPFPKWAVRRGSPWIYFGWIQNPTDSACSLTFEELVAQIRDPDYSPVYGKTQASKDGEEHVVDVYPEGATHYYRKV